MFDEDPPLDATFDADEKTILIWNKNAELDDHLFDPFAAVHRAKDQENATGPAGDRPLRGTGMAINVGHVVSADAIARRVAVDERHERERRQQQQKRASISPSPNNRENATRDLGILNGNNDDKKEDNVHVDDGQPYQSFYHHNVNPIRHIPAKFQRFSTAASSIATSRPQSALTDPVPGHYYHQQSNNNNDKTSTSPERNNNNNNNDGDEQQQHSSERTLKSLVCKKTSSVSPSRQQQEQEETTPSSPPPQQQQFKSRSINLSNNIINSASPASSLMLPPVFTSSVNMNNDQRNRYFGDDQGNNEHSFMDKSKNYLPGQRPLSADVSPRTTKRRYDLSHQSPKNDASSNVNVCLRILEREGDRISPIPQNEDDDQQQQQRAEVSPRSILPRLEMMNNNNNDSKTTRPGTAPSLHSSPQKGNNNHTHHQQQQNQPLLLPEHSPYLVTPAIDPPKFQHYSFSSSLSPHRSLPKQHRQNHPHHLATLDHPDVSFSPDNKSARARDALLQQQHEHQQHVQLQTTNLTQSKMQIANHGLILPLSLDSDGIFTSEQKLLASLDVPVKNIDKKKLKYQLVASSGVKFPSTLLQSMMIEESK